MSKLTLTYAGRRISGDKVLHCFVHNKREYYFRAIKYVILGDQYQAKREGKHVTLPQRPERLGSAELSEEIRELWESKDQAAEQFLRTRRAAAKAKREGNTLWIHLEAAHLRYRKLSYEERRAFLDYCGYLIALGKGVIP